MTDHDQDAQMQLAALDHVRRLSEVYDVYDTERHLLYVACTRARDHLLVTGVAPASEFLGDMRS